MESDRSWNPAGKRPLLTGTVADVSDHLAELRDHLDREGGRPLADVRVATGRVGQRISESLTAGADNLLVKAIRALTQGDQKRARGLIERAAGLPFDEHEEWQPGLWSAYMLLFEAVTDQLEASDPGDATWLDAALDVLDACGPDGALSLRRVLSAAASDWKLERRELRRVHQAVLDVDADALLQLRLDTGETSAAQVIVETLEALIAYQRALGAGA
jgi:hypothetical protein